MFIHGLNSRNNQEMLQFFNLLSTSLNQLGNGKTSQPIFPAFSNNNSSATLASYESQMKMLMDILGLSGQDTKISKTTQTQPPKSTQLEVNANNVINENAGLKYYSKDENGNLVMYEYGKDGSSYTITEFTENDKTRPSRVSSYETRNGKDILVNVKNYSDTNIKGKVSGNQSEKLNYLDGGVTHYNNKYGIYKDEQGNSVYRVDYGNNDASNIYDEEEVRSPEGKLLSFTERTYGDDEMYYKKYIYDDNEKLVKIVETTCDKSGNPKSTKELPLENEPRYRGYVSIGIPVDGVQGDPELKSKLKEYGTTLIGHR